MSDSAYCLPLVAALAMVAVFLCAYLRARVGHRRPRLSFLPGLRGGLFSLIFRGLCRFAGGVVNMCE